MFKQKCEAFPASNGMKKYLISIFILFSPIVLYAATVNFSPASVSIEEGQTFSLAVSADAGAEKIVTVKAALAYQQDIVEPISFTFAESWFSLTQSGFDSMENGTVIKTAGLPGGFTGTREFGTVVFRAKRAGAATVSVANESFMLNSQNINALASVSTAAITVAAPAARAPAIEKTLDAELTTDIGEGAPFATTSATSTQSAAIAESSIPSRSVILIIVLIAAIFAGLVWRMYKNSRRHPMSSI
ncbi:MAG: hypothetical protein A3H13_02420 [Candidatus Taylorbacteria bacterium RIFCSPLOWO2_12_FULL_48_11]|uniref:Cohesin domain-containing protein n=1 Tax=Candidatus Taylorbacteria bacterium RIFCSPLOWO2_01_FULL_48_100 TaxID=1802322 RepID=A0A1G2ND85_9BACT|nr:MAG: hypothetical protein A2670_02960 [Candidatus Taylorbacteria bacterium RIFCSPHIGHO2_01_FULL_48_38]OHA34075.1 MAG: hypothetical protein A2938_00115 [Candidatus Taylorbacteria bacterium RIFCSPLOWO2_01_FULL_48_100]OHA40559.1 MAG: hypothetical protein A3J31_00740 [Candidatus Taylorbacteria bacterium RIFCSPLOWO2_02_FULL_48_16]OHA45576.1 MAG: hypothetical protein A3H13_02420 [Candidatus Taylorbacteria bacterium RIFCSPLOWO2_12_FULL_48_11]